MATLRTAASIFRRTTHAVLGACIALLVAMWIYFEDLVWRDR